LSFGLFGPEGLGLVKAHGLSQKDVPLRLITFGKALAGQGAVVAGKKIWIDALLQQARSYIYSTALSPALAYGMIKAFDVLRGADERRLKLNRLVGYFQQQCENSSLIWRKSVSPIQQLQLGCPHLAKQLSDDLLTQGIFCQAIRQPTVTRQETGLRVVLNYRHTEGDLDRLFHALTYWRR
jgi:8-amino-7-oxononanoate synthase